MKLFFSGLAIGLFVIATLAFTSAHRVYADILRELSISEDDANEYIFSNFKEGKLTFPYSKVIKSLAMDKREAAVKAMGDYIRQYTTSTLFLEQYKEAREAAKPEAPANKEEKIKKRLEEIKKDIEESEKAVSENTGDMKKLYQLTLDQLKQEQKALQDPSHPMYSSYMFAYGQTNSNTSNQYKQDMAYYEKEYPADPKLVIKRRLKEFLDLTATIDFNAPLVEKYGKKRFVDPKLEAKGADWKRCFRSGKETVTAARAYATQWLKELN